MNDGKIIIDKIIAMAEKEVQKIESVAKAEADSILKTAQDKEAKEQSKLDEMVRVEGEKIRTKEISSAELDAKMKVLNEKQRMLEEVIDLAQSRLESLPDGEYEKVLDTMLDSLEASYGKNIVVSPKDQETHGDFIASKGFSILETRENIEGGFIIKNQDVEYNYTFASILAIEQEEIKHIIAKILF